MKTLTTVALVLSSAALLGGCALESDENADRYRQALPAGEEVQVAGPAEDTAAGNGAASADGASGADDFAHYYGFTREVRGGVNHITFDVLALVSAIADYPPTRVSDDRAVWGPWTDSLEPVTWRLVITEVEQDEYTYVFEGRPKTSERDADFRAVLSGVGYGEAHPNHGDGHFTFDADVARDLDPWKHEDDSGTLTITHTLSTPMKTVRAEAVPSDSPAWWTATSMERPNGTGILLVDAYDDVEDEGGTERENISIESQWRGDGAGRADITLTGGDLTPGMTVNAVECWDTGFYRVYYSDSVNYEVEQGDATACAYSEPPPKF